MTAAYEKNLSVSELIALGRLIDLYHFLFVPGQSFITDGQRGSGKTHHAVAIAWQLLNGKQPKGAKHKYVLLTNVIFLRKTKNGTVKETPENVFHVTTMKAMLRQIGEILMEYGRDVRILLLLDEAQNFMMSDINSDKVNLAIIRWQGTARKFNCSTWFLSPTVKNFVPRIRNYEDDDEPGYMNGKWRKDIPRARKAIEDLGLDCEPRDLITVQYGRYGKVRMIPVPTCPWCRSIEEIEVGEYCYDHLASADFTLGEDFDIKPFITAVSDVPSDKMAATILEYFEKLDAGEDGEDVPVDQLIIRHSLECAHRAKDLDLTGCRKLSDEKLAYIFGLTPTSFRRYRAKWLSTKGGGISEEGVDDTAET